MFESKKRGAYCRWFGRDRQRRTSRAGVRGQVGCHEAGGSDGSRLSVGGLSVTGGDADRRVDGRMDG